MPDNIASVPRIRYGVKSGGSIEVFRADAPWMLRFDRQIGLMYFFNGVTCYQFRMVVFIRILYLLIFFMSFEIGIDYIVFFVFDYFAINLGDISKKKLP